MKYQKLFLLGALACLSLISCASLRDEGSLRLPIDLLVAIGQLDQACITTIEASSGSFPENVYASVTAVGARGERITSAPREATNNEVITSFDIPIDQKCEYYTLEGVSVFSGENGYLAGKYGCNGGQCNLELREYR